MVSEQQVIRHRLDLASSTVLGPPERPFASLTVLASRLWWSWLTSPNHRDLAMTCHLRFRDDRVRQIDPRREDPCPTSEVRWSSERAT